MGGETAINHQFSACNITGFVAGDKGHQIGNLRWLTDAPDGLQADNVGFGGLPIRLRVQPIVDGIRRVVLSR